MIHLTVRELKDEAKRQGLKGYSTLRKDDLIWLLKQHYDSTGKSSLNYDDGYAVLPLANLSKGGGGTASIGSGGRSHPRRGNGDRWSVYTKNGCPYCTKAKNLLDRKKIAYEEHKITPTNRQKILDSLDVVTGGYRYVPIIIKNGEFVGGFSELSDVLK